MASFYFLWKHRAKFSIGSKLFYKAWAKRLFSLPDLVSANYRRALLQLKGAKIHETAEIGKASIAGHSHFLSIGQESFLGRVSIALHDNVIIGERVCINDGVELLTGSHNVNHPKWEQITGKIVIDDYAWIGTGAMILPGVQIGRGAVIGARAVVSKSVPAGAIVVGNPGKPILKKRCVDLNYNPCEFLTANRSWLLG